MLDDILDVAGISVSAHKERRKRGTSGKMHLRASPQRRDRIFIVRVENICKKRGRWNSFSNHNYSTDQ